MTSTRSSREERKNSQFRRVFGWQLKHNRIFTLFYSACLLGGLPIATLCNILNDLDYYTNMNNWRGSTAAEVSALFAQTVANELNSILSILVVPICLIYIFCYCYNTFGFMHNRRSVDLFHSLPLKRTPLFMGSYLAGLVSIYVPLAVSFGLTQLVCTLYHIAAPVTPVMIWEAFGLFALLLTACFTFTSFFIVSSGTLIDGVVSLLATAGGWPILYFVVHTTLDMFLPGYSYFLFSSGISTALCPYGALYLLFRRTYYYEAVSTSSAVSLPYSVSAVGLPYSVSTWFLLWWVGFILFFLLVTVLCYNYRKSECAENSFSFPVICGAIRFLIATTGGLTLANALGQMLNRNAFYLAGVIVGSLATHIVIQVIWARGFRKFWRTIPAYALTLAVSLSFLFALYEGGLGFVSRIPTLEAVTKVEISDPNIPGDDSKECYLANNAILYLVGEEEYYDSFIPSFTDPEDIAAVQALHQALLTKFPGPYLPCTDEPRNYDQTTYSFTLTYTLSNGKTLVREYDVPLSSGDTEILNNLAAVQKLDTYQLYAPFYSTNGSHIFDISVYRYTDQWEYNACNDKLTQKEKDKVWDTFVEELNSPSFSNKVELDDYSAHEIVTKTIDETTQQVVDSETSSSYDLAARSDYTITTSVIELSELSPEQRALVERLCPDKTIDCVDSDVSYTIPECCEKTRALIDKLTEEYGQTYTYDE